MEVIKLDDLLVSLEDIDKSMEGFCKSAGNTSRLFCPGSFCRGNQQNADGPEDNKRAKETIEL